MNLIDALKDLAGRSPLTSTRSRPVSTLETCVLCVPSVGLTACSSGGSNAADSGAPSTSDADGTSPSQGPVGNFAVVLNPAIEDAPHHTSTIGKVHSASNPSETIETVIASDSNCKVYKYSIPGCFEPACTTDEVCVALNVCVARPSLVSVGDVSVDGVGPSALMLTRTNYDYQYPLNLPYPGVTEGQPVTLTGTGGGYSAFTVSAKGVAPLVLSDSSHLISKNQPLTVNWTPGAASAGAEVTVTLNISKHGGSAGYMQCKTTDSGSLTIAADVLQKLVGLGTAGFPELLVKRTTHGEVAVSTGKISFDVQAEAKPALNIEGNCSCFTDSDCGSCTDKTKTSCDSLKRLCKTP
jgi:hypothetical protein